MALTSQQLIGYQLAEFTIASNRRLWMIALQFLVAAAAAAAVLTDDHTDLYFLGVAGAVLLVAWVMAERSYRKHREAAERGRRATLLIDGLGHPVSQSELAILKEAFIVPAEKASKYEDPKYFAAKAPAGPKRLTEMLAESAFWTSRLQSKSVTLMIGMFVVIVIGTLVVGLIAFPIAKHEQMVTAVRVFLAFLTFLLSTDVWGAIQGHLAAINAIEDVRARLRTISATDYPLSDLLLAMNDYNAAVESGPLNFPYAYKFFSTQLNKEWREIA